MNEPDWTYWLQMMNLAMAAVVVGAGITIFIAIAGALRERRLRHAGEAQGVDEEMVVMLREQSHRIHVPELGLTMADGGEELKSSDHQPDDKRQ